MNITVGAHQYLIGKLDARKQFHVVRRITPLLAAVGNRANAESGDVFIALALGMAEGLASMKDEELDFVIDTCLGVVQRFITPEKAGPLMAGGKLMYEDLSMQDMIRLTVEVLRENCGDFFAQLTGALGLPVSALPFAAVPAEQPPST